MSKSLSDRKLKILQLIVECYIESAEPVGSRTISKNEDLGVSAATVRNEMSDLEEMGFLVQPHVSAGRVPSSTAYYYYVDKLMEDLNLSNDHKEAIENSFKENIENIDNLLSHTIKLLSEMTSYVSLGVTKEKKSSSIITHFDLVMAGEGKAIILLVLDDDKVKHFTINIDTSITKEKLSLIAKVIKDDVTGRKYQILDESFAHYLKDKIRSYSELIDEMVEAISSDSDNEGFTVVLNGATNIFDYPEFSEVSTAKSLLSLLENEKDLLNLVNIKGIEKNGINIIIGDETMGEALENCSVITAEFSDKNKKHGKIGIIGPRRMDYEKIYSLLNYISNKLNSIT